uniref:Multidrug resistance protein, MATE family n=1 Tax=Candidatus Kentrum sp. FM TaxID=2126340 RepID=A0A450WAD8_9GAMM|nr:MAG: multidrug resistance protein, MATE family [Candidatus Kentron sp. FM]VFJ66687.1 MAG: multidrug resistance protein, MATE family [Candidatus Kentron sp. FM]VFK13911.1 MAG: multidrug resistance protein, MATE family [Candidatus Kentron sp. FM]
MPSSRLPTTTDIRATLEISLPLGLAFMGSVAIGITDSLILGRLGAEVLGAAGLALSIYGMLFMVGHGMLFPVMMLVSHARGANRSRTAPRIIRQGLWVAGFLFVPGLAILWNLEKILLLAGQNPDLARMAGHYMDYFLWALLPALTSSVFALALTAMGRGGMITRIVWFQMGLNIVLDYVLIFGKFGFPAMGMAGAGLASAIVSGTGHMLFFFVLSFHRFYRSTARFRYAWRPKWAIIGRIFYLGWPKTLERVVQGGLFSTITLLVGWRLGVEAIASHSIALQIYPVAHIVISYAIASAITTRVGIAHGAQDYAGTWRIINTGLLICFFFLVPLVAFLKIFSPWVVMLFIGSDLKALTLLPIASPLIVIVAFFILVDGLRLIAGQALNGLSDIKMPALMMGLGQWGVGFPAALVFGLAMDLGILGFWWGLTLGVAVIGMMYLARFRWLVDRLSTDVPGNGWCVGK